MFNLINRFVFVNIRGLFNYAIGFYRKNFQKISSRRLVD